MEYISHEDYKKMLTGFGKEVPKAKLNEGLEKEGNAFTAGLAKTKKGGEFKVGDKSFKDRTNYDASVSEELDSPYDGGADDLASMAKDEEGDAEVLSHVKRDIYKIKSPSGNEVDVDFESHLEEEVDPPYGWSGYIDGSDGEYDYYMDCEFVDEGGGSYDWYPDFKSLEATPVRNTPIKETDSMVDTKLTKIAGLYKDKAIKHEEIEKIVNALTGQGHEINVRYVQEFLKNHDVQLDEYQFDQMYPDDPGPFEGIEQKLKEFLAKEDDVNWDRMDDEEAEENETDNGIEEDEMEEDINLPSSQPTGPSIEEKRSRLAHLTSEERDQLKQYVETIKTVKMEIKKMVGKQDMEEGGDNTNLIIIVWEFIS